MLDEVRSGGRASPKLVDFCPLLAILLDTERIHRAVELRRHPSLLKVHIKSVTVAGRHDCRLGLLKKENMGRVSIIWLLCSDCLWELLSKSWMSLTNHYVSKKGHECLGIFRAPPAKLHPERYKNMYILARRNESINRSVLLEWLSEGVE